jgi:hypothetical protein
VPDAIESVGTMTPSRFVFQSDITSYCTQDFICELVMLDRMSWVLWHNSWMSGVKHKNREVGVSAGNMELLALAPLIIVSNMIPSSLPYSGAQLFKDWVLF